MQAGLAASLPGFRQRVRRRPELKQRPEIGQETLSVTALLDERNIADYDNNVIMTSPRRVRLTDYAQLRMHQRDILEEEVRAVLDRPPSAHRRRPDGRSEVSGKLPKGQLLVVYQRRKRDIRVINAIWE